MKAKVKMSDIAKVLGVSTVTVSKALASKEGVSDDLRHKIRAKAQELGYKMSSVSQAMRTGRQNNIGIIISERYLEEHSYYWSLYQNLLVELIKKGYFGILEIITVDDEKQLVIPRVITENKIDALIIVGQLRKRYLNLISAEMDEKLMFLDFYDLYLPVSTVTADNFNGGYSLTKYLIDQGHNDILYVGDIHQTTSIMDRAMGYYKCMLDFHKQIRSEWYISDRNEEGFIINPKLPSKMPSAFVCNSDITARKLYEVLKLKNLKVPEDVSIVGYDNFPSEVNFELQITTMEVGRDRLAQSAVKIIDNIMTGTNVSERINLTCKLIEKQSVKKLI
jgi:DNA-binding LacI/PurR family transcriptional regulator